ncbi:hypothetical protein GOBAR_DD02466 [Gossypium barbadense]|nr:hypothetical protein GOBAR_DD02466 [Gossypium barbadense]
MASGVGLGDGEEFDFLEGDVMKSTIDGAEGNETVADSMVTDVEKAETLGMFGLWMQVERKSWQMLDEIEGRNGAESVDQLEGSEVKKGSSMEKNPGSLGSLLSNSVCSASTSVPSHHLEFFDSAAGIASSLSLTRERLVGTISHFNPIFEDLEKHSLVSFKENVNTNDVNSIGRNFGKLGFIGRSSGAKSDVGRNGKKLNRIIYECGGLFKLVESHRAPLSDTMNSMV